MPSIAENLADVRARMERAAERAGRAPGSVLLLAVTKTQPPERVREVYAAGQRHFAENRIQEFERKRPLLELPGSEWHLVGHLQSNKSHRAVQLFDVIETVDSDLPVCSAISRYPTRCLYFKGRIRADVPFSALFSQEGPEELWSSFGGFRRWA